MDSFQKSYPTSAYILIYFIPPYLMGCWNNWSTPAPPASMDFYPGKFLTRRNLRMSWFLLPTKVEAQPVGETRTVSRSHHSFYNFRDFTVFETIETLHDMRPQLWQFFSRITLPFSLLHVTLLVIFAVVPTGEPGDTGLTLQWPTGPGEAVEAG